MTAVTQCPQCGTRFRVVPDQLKISHGWVRCGKCAEVFNAREALETAAALKAGQPAPVASARPAVVPQQVSIVLRQQVTASPAPAAPQVPASSPRLVPPPEPALPPPPHPPPPLPLPAKTSPPLASAPRPVPVSVPGDAVDAPLRVAEHVSGHSLDAPPALPAWLIKPVAVQAEAVNASMPPVSADAVSPPLAPLVPLAENLSVLQQTVAHWVQADEPEPEPEPEPMPEPAPEPEPAPASKREPERKPEPESSSTEVFVVPSVDPEPEPEPEPAFEPSSEVSVHDASGQVPVLPAPAAPSEPAAEVGFIRQARRKAAWASTPVRVALGVLALVAGALLTLQVAIHERNRLAVMAPTLKPWLIQLCAPIGCEVGPYLNIEAVEIVSTELIRAKDGTYRFELSLRNAAQLPVAMPAVELSLTDRNSEAVVRRVVLPQDWVEAPSALMPHSETGLTLKMSLVNLDELRMEGFRAVVFYP